MSASVDEQGANAVQEPPVGFLATLRRLGPGLIVAGSIVGAGELVMTTRLGAQVGFALLWMVLFSCVAKVALQIEMGRYTISSGETCLKAFDRVPGPRWRANWLVWYWVVMTVATLILIGGVLGGVGQALQLAFPALDDRWWSVVVAASGIALLVRGRYHRIEVLSTAMVVTFTLVTVGSVVATQSTSFRISLDQVIGGLKLQMPKEGLATAFAAFGITGIGAAELTFYSYWCLEKGYARFAGPRSEEAAWAARARGWIRVMGYDAWLCMLVYTVATVAFYVLGAAVLHRAHNVPGDIHLVETLAQMYEPTFGAFARHVLLVGAFAVLYSTFFVGTASFARLGADCLALYGLIRDEPASRGRWQSIFCVAFPILCLASYLVGRQPVAMVAISGVTQALMLPLIGIALIYLRARRTDRRVRGGPLASVSLWLATVACAVAASYGAYATVRQALAPAKKAPSQGSQQHDSAARKAGMERSDGPAAQ